MKLLTKENLLQIAEMTDSESFILITCDSKLPCEEALAGIPCGGHRYGFNSHYTDHAHAVMTLENALEKIMKEGLPPQV